MANEIALRIYDVRKYEDHKVGGKSLPFFRATVTKPQISPNCFDYNILVQFHHLNQKITDEEYESSTTDSGEIFYRKKEYPVINVTKSIVSLSSTGSSKTDDGLPGNEDDDHEDDVDVEEINPNPPYLDRGLTTK